MLRVIINGVPLLKARSGIGTYVYYNFSAMREIESDWSPYFYYGSQLTNQIKAPQPVAGFPELKHKLPDEKRYFSYRFLLDKVFNLRTRLKKFHLYHETDHVPMPFQGPTVLTIHDLSFIHYPETHPKARLWYLDKYFYSRLNWVTQFITVSVVIQKEMMKYLSIPQSSITVIPLGVSNQFRPHSERDLICSLKKYGLTPQSFLLYVGAIEPRKNLSVLLRAYAALPSSLRKGKPLVLAGGSGWLMEEFDEQIQKLKIHSTVLKLGYIPTEDLPALYCGAVAFIYPSLYEGFGLPPLEAMACGTPVIISNAPALQEVAGNVAIQVDPYDVEGLTEAIHLVISSPEIRESMKKNGLERAKCFSWRKTAAQTLNVYQKVIS
jgi:alpha-1,3-rhamnosyl/mannosyltransferase